MYDSDIMDLEDYTPERIAQFLLTNAIDEEDLTEAIKEVRAMGLDPCTWLSSTNESESGHA